MQEEYIEVTQITWFEKLGSSCLGAFFALLAFLFSFYVLFWNEGRVNLAEIAKTAIDISAFSVATSIDAHAQGKLISVTGVDTSNAPLGDGLFLLPGKYILVDRTVEMYAWDETENTHREKHVGGSETRTTTYTYSSEWTNRPENSSSFRDSANHQNPPKAFPDQLYKVPSFHFGRYTLDLSSLTQVLNHRNSCVQGSTTIAGVDVNLPEAGGMGINLPEAGHLQLTPQNSRVSGGAIRMPDYLFKGRGSPDHPNVGDLRVCYTVLLAGQGVTAFGKLDGTQIVPYVHQNTQIQRLIPGTRITAIALLGREEALWRWVFRVGGWLLMWMGLAFMGTPVAAFLDVIPWVGDVAEGMALAGSAITTLILSIITILVSSLVHHPVALAVALCFTIGVLLILPRARR